jgi:hypothetical protein
MKWVVDKALSEYQQKLKWYIYLELDMERNEDIKVVLESLLRDVNSLGRSLTHS